MRWLDLYSYGVVIRKYQIKVIFFSHVYYKSRIDIEETDIY